MSGIRHVVLELHSGFRSAGYDSSVIFFQRDADRNQLSALFGDRATVVQKEGKFSLGQLFGLGRYLSKSGANITIHHSPLPCISHCLVRLINGRSGPIPLFVHHQARDAVSRAKTAIELIGILLAPRNIAVGHNCLPKPNGLVDRIKRGSMTVIPNPIGCSGNAQLSAQRSSSGAKNVVMVGRFVKQKDFFTLIEAFRIAVRRAPEEELHLHIAGSGPQQQEILNRLSNLPQDSYTFHGELSHADTKKLIGSAGLYVQSTNSEADFSTSVLTAMQLSIPVIASAAPGIREEFDDPETAPIQLVQASDALSLASAILGMVRHPERGRAAAALARDFVERKHGCETVMSLWEREFQSDLRP